MTIWTDDIFPLNRLMWSICPSVTAASTSGTGLDRVSATSPICLFQLKNVDAVLTDVYLTTRKLLISFPPVG